MIIDILTGFPEIFSGLVNSSILRGALLTDTAEIWVHNLRHFTDEPHGNIDDAPFGGGPGMVMMAQPVWSAMDFLIASRKKNPLRIYLTPQGIPLTQSKVRELAAVEWLILLCGHYKDVDARIFKRDEWLEISVGDYILSGGEIPAAMLVDAVTRLLPGAISDPASADSDSFEDGLLDAPYYTRPEEISGWRVPDMLLSGHHGNIRKWRFDQRLERTKIRRPDLWKTWSEIHSTNKTID
ncbi:tRNA (guanosine(37)-N1)-methyltransferase TrmD [candidate division KSB1 bacterium]|nr:MAG: tRNA (guanosine(37)-N1)-methyltransferase TrmD [candidate division KSB1 bacterium]